MILEVKGEELFFSTYNNCGISLLETAESFPLGIRSGELRISLM